MRETTLSRLIRGQWQIEQVRFKLYIQTAWHPLNKETPSDQSPRSSLMSTVYWISLTVFVSSRKSKEMPESCSIIVWQMECFESASKYLGLFYWGHSLNRDSEVFLLFSLAVLSNQAVHAKLISISGLYGAQSTFGCLLLLVLRLFIKEHVLMMISV